ncbi:hypothetical protein TNCT_474741 [Trichonephila clavata]|uniref:Uncharacterized protein n=1 Tax=Trichonephila clavata TaxID=2740835 RepID=A0A8X6FF00_TRICU|nr:hypothetical protein TNCT_474741 [Trichonephila clavata]
MAQFELISFGRRGVAMELGKRERNSFRNVITFQKGDDSKGGEGWSNPISGVHQAILINVMVLFIRSCRTGMRLEGKRHTGTL